MVGRGASGSGRGESRRDMVKRERDPKKTTLYLPSSQLTYSLYYLDGVRAEK